MSRILILGQNSWHEFVWKCFMKIKYNWKVVPIEGKTIRDRYYWAIFFLFDMTALCFLSSILSRLDTTVDTLIGFMAKKSYKLNITNWGHMGRLFETKLYFAIISISYHNYIAVWLIISVCIVWQHAFLLCWKRQVKSSLKTLSPHDEGPHRYWWHRVC